MNVMPATPPSSRRTTRANASPAFTLIEVLVVVAIIALLAAVLIPSLQRARTQAKLTMCKANAKQIAYTLNMYQNENKGLVPILFNYFASEWYPDSQGVKSYARLCWLSVAFRQYDRATIRLKEIVRAYGPLNPEDYWPIPKRDDYEDHVMPAHYACPFERERGTGYDRAYSDARFDYWNWTGRFESYHTWFHDGVMIRNQPVNGTSWPGGPGPDLKGIPQYSAFTFNRKEEPGQSPTNDRTRKYAHRLWKLGREAARKYQTGSLSEIAVVYCAQGEHIQWPQSGGASRIGRANVGSHATGRGGGTNVIFADSHVEWVVGTRIGLP